VSEFFVGYLPTIPPNIARTVWRAVAGILLGTIAAAIILAASQHRFPPAAFEYGKVRDFEGMIEEQPYPVLLVKRPGIVAVGDAYSRYMLVGAGKHAADVAGLAGKYVKLRGTLIYRGHEALIEVIPGSLQATGPSFAPDAPVNLGPVTLTGEIVDSKCYFGVMNPGAGKVHRDCAARCLSGGIPPAFIALDPEGRSHVYMLANADGGKIPADWAADRAARPIALRGELMKSGDTETLFADLNSAHFVDNLRPATATSSK
jgi:hypothetical protein